MTSLTVFSSIRRISATISSRPSVVQPQMPSLTVTTLSPAYNCRSPSTSGLQQPQDAEALVQALISPTLVQPPD
ncbi:hypothetical protein D3C74_429280 [compost metagenome]